MILLWLNDVFASVSLDDTRITSTDAIITCEWLCWPKLLVADMISFQFTTTCEMSTNSCLKT